MNIQRQAVPLLVTEAPYVGTGIEYKAAKDSGVVILAENPETIEFVDADYIRIRRDEDNGTDEFKLLKFKRSNQGTCINQTVIVNKGDVVKKGDGSHTNYASSRNYTLEEYCTDIVESVMATVDEHKLPHSHILTESGQTTKIGRAHV